MATELESGDHEPHRRHSHQEPEDDRAEGNARLKRAPVYVAQKDALKRPKPDGQSKRHEHRYANEMLHHVCVFRNSPFERSLSLSRSSSVYAGHATDATLPGRESILRQLQVDSAFLGRPAEVRRLRLGVRSRIHGPSPGRHRC